MTRHFLSLADLNWSELQQVVHRAIALRAEHGSSPQSKMLQDHTLGLIFEKPSTRTFTSCAAAMTRHGGNFIVLDVAASQLSRGEPLADTVRVVSHYVHGLMFRTTTTARLHVMAKSSTVPVINALTDDEHPLQLLADLTTLQAHFGVLEGLTVAFVGDGRSNMARTWILAANLCGFALRIASPQAFEPEPEWLRSSSCRIKATHDPIEAARQADVVCTDVWASMGQEQQAAQRREQLAPYALTSRLMAAASAAAVVLHCLPAHRGEEISSEVLDGPRSLVLAEAHNRLHATAALLEFLWKENASCPKTAPSTKC